MRYSLEDSNGNVLNVIEWDGVAKYPLELGQRLVADPSGVKQPPPITNAGRNPIAARLAKLEADVDTLKKG